MIESGQTLTMSTGTHINIRWYYHQLLSTSMKVTFPQIHGCFLHVSLCASQPGEFPTLSPSCSIKGSFFVSIKLLMPRKQSILSQQCPLRCALPLTLLCWTAPPLWFPELKGADLTGSREAEKKGVFGFDILVVIKENYFPRSGQDFIQQPERFACDKTRGKKRREKSNYL